MTFITEFANGLEWPLYLDRESSQSADMRDMQLPGSDGGKRYTFIRTNEHSGQRFQMTLLERDDHISELGLTFRVDSGQSKVAAVAANQNPPPGRCV